MSKAIIIREGSGFYGVDAKRVIDYLVKPTLAQHVPDDGRLEAALRAIEYDFQNAFDINLADIVETYPKE